MTMVFLAWCYGFYCPSFEVDSLDACLFWGASDTVGAEVFAFTTDWELPVGEIEAGILGLVDYFDLDLAGLSVKIR